ncbi:MAG: hypothetical protein V1802_01370 [Candidatus Aenigmatarchaeota archaeon]
MKISAMQAFDEIRFEHAYYAHSGNVEQDEYLIDIEKIGHELLLRNRRFVPRNETFESLLKPYGPSEVVIDYVSKYHSEHRENAQIIKCVVVNGKQASDFMKYCFNSFGKIREPPFYGRLPLETIGVSISESAIWRRTMHLEGIIDLPQLGCSELINIIVSELNNYIDK